MQFNRLRFVIFFVLLIPLFDRSVVAADPPLAPSQQAFFDQLKQASDRGDATAQATLGEIYQNGLHGVQQNYALALQWDLKAANGGDHRGQRQLAQLYQNGLGVTKDLFKAAYWFQKSALQGDMLSQSNLGAQYELGLGVSQNFNEAARWLERASEQGDASSQAILAEFYLDGKGVEKDFPTSYFWSILAVQNGYTQATELRDFLQTTLSKHVRLKTEKRARSWKPKLETPPDAD